MTWDKFIQYCFKCDECGKERDKIFLNTIATYNVLYMKEILKEEGWVFSKTYDKDFCSKECYRSYIRG